MPPVLQVAHTSTGDARVEEILATAERMFFERGFRGVSIRDLAAAIGIKMSSLYHYFDSKDEILYRILKRHVDGLLDAVERNAEALGPNAASLERLRGLVTTSIVYLLTDPMAGEIAASQTRELEGERREEIRRAVRSFEQRYKDTIAEGIARGEFIATDPGVAAFALLGAVARLTVWYRPEGRLNREEIATVYSEILVRGLAVHQA